MSILLEARKAKILQLLVKDYVENCEPVGSKRIAETYGIRVKSATIRNEMAELGEMGLLTQPHRSAGRIPSELGYRVFVDSLMERCHMDPGAGRIITEALRQKNEIEMLISAACKVLSDICGYAVCACYPTMKNTYINYVSVSKYGPKRLLLVAAASNSYIIHRIVNIDIDKAMYSVEAAENFLNAAYQKRELKEIAAEAPREGMFRTLSEEFLEAVRSEGRDKRDRQYYYEGIAKLLRLPEFRDAASLEQVIGVLEDEEQMEKITGTGEDSVRIGTENHIPGLSQCSVISGCYRIHGVPSGGIAVIGPTRMDYSHSLGALELVKEQLEIMLNSLLS